VSAPAVASAPSAARLEHVARVYLTGDVEVRALDDVSLDFPSGSYTAIVGQSGSGKSTLLNLLGLLDRPTSGRYLLGGEDVSVLGDDRLSQARGRRLGFVFQSFHLIPHLTVLENIEVPMEYADVPPREMRERARALAERMGLGHRLDHRPTQLSGGQQQRVAIARALANRPIVLLADEPTGNLDSATGVEILALLDELHAQGTTLIVVTHDAKVAARAERVVRMLDGRVESLTRSRGAG
jgi:putative ABC transport system ATP-binding protein